MISLLVIDLVPPMGLTSQFDKELNIPMADVMVSLDRLHLGVMLISHAGQMLHANHAVHRLIKRNDGMTCTASGWLDASPINPLQPRLGEWLKSQCSPTLSHVEHFSHAYLMRRIGHKGLYSLQCRPLAAGLNCQIKGQAVGAVVRVADPGAQSLPSAARLENLFGFTPAQALVARELATGKGSKDVAQVLGISHETVRSHTRQIYEKMCVQSQPELVRTIMSLGHPRV